MLPVNFSLPALGLALAIGLSAPAPAAAQAVTPAPAVAPGAFVRPVAPGRLVDVGGGRRLHIRCKGEGASGPTVVFEAGLSQYTANSTYGLAQDAVLAALPGTRVCTYDRAGLGWSDAAPADWTLQAMTTDLHRLLAAAGIEGKVVLVGHSFGGLLARMYATAWPDEVAGVVLLDATGEADFAGFDAAAAAVVPQIDQALSSSRPGQPVVGMPAGSSPELVMSFTPEILAGVKAEFGAWMRLDPALKRPGGFGSLGETPLVVVRRGKASTPPTPDDIAHREAQEAMAGLSSNGLLMVAENSGHTIPLDEPPVVAEAVSKVMQAIRSRRSPT
jgi:pimeloyl-ACP methyl ester carboxylesterase